MNDPWKETSKRGSSSQTCSAFNPVKESRRIKGAITRGLGKTAAGV